MVCPQNGTAVVSERSGGDINHRVQVISCMNYGTAPVEVRDKQTGWERSNEREQDREKGVTRRPSETGRLCLLEEKPTSTASRW